MFAKHGQHHQTILTRINHYQPWWATLNHASQLPTIQPFLTAIKQYCHDYQALLINNWSYSIDYHPSLIIVSPIIDHDQQLYATTPTATWVPASGSAWWCPPGGRALSFLESLCPDDSGDLDEAWHVVHLEDLNMKELSWASKVFMLESLSFLLGRTESVMDLPVVSLDISPSCVVR